jgi:hypothetical protein
MIYGEHFPCSNQFYILPFFLLLGEALNPAWSGQTTKLLKRLFITGIRNSTT